MKHYLNPLNMKAVASLLLHIAALLALFVPVLFAWVLLAPLDPSFAR